LAAKLSIGVLMLGEPKKIALYDAVSSDRLVPSKLSTRWCASRELPVKRQFRRRGNQSVSISRNRVCHKIKGAMQRPADIITHRAARPLQPPTHTLRKRVSIKPVGRCLGAATGVSEMFEEDLDLGGASFNRGFSCERKSCFVRPGLASLSGRGGLCDAIALAIC
jgi:hypothetical protein